MTLIQIKLEKEAWRLYYKLSQKIYQKSPFGDHFSAIYTPSERHCRIANKAFDRWIRRQQALESSISRHERPCPSSLGRSSV